MTGKQSIESTLQKVQAGELSPSEASRRLIANSGTSTPEQRESDLQTDQAGAQDAGTGQGETLDSLISRLGKPPLHVVDACCQKLLDSDLGPQITAIHIDLRDWSLTQQGQLLYAGDRHASASDSSASNFAALPIESSPSARSAELAESFRAAMLVAVRGPLRSFPQPGDRSVAPPGQSGTGGSQRLTSADANGRSPARYEITDSNRKTEPAIVRRRLWWPSALLVALLFCVCTVLAIRMGSKSATGPHKPSTAPITLPANIDTGAPTSAAVAKQIPESHAVAAERGSGAPVPNLQTIDLFGVSEFDPDQNVHGDQSRLLLLDAWMPTLPTALTDTTPNERVLPEVKATHRADANQIVRAGSNPDESSFQDKDLPTESPQQTRFSPNAAMELSDVSNTSMVTEIPFDHPKHLELEFPSKLPLELTAPINGSWRIRDTRSELNVGSIEMASNAVSFRWSSEAIHCPASSSLAHGRLIDQDHQSIYLRPRIESAPWLLRFDQQDAMPTWDLTHPVLPRVSRLSLQLVLPEQIQQHWIESIETAQPRRTRGFVMLEERDEESVALGLRFDVRCGRKLSCRLRVAARLDSNMPWQGISNDAVEESANQLARRLAWIDLEAERLERLYDFATSAQRRLLRQQQEYRRTEKEVVAATAERILRLQRLMALIESNGSVDLGIHVQWPDQTQTIFQTQSMPSEN
ncbi:MAG: hypothetical protein ACR2NZ_00985 [Rubripirellula sp.]